MGFKYKHFEVRSGEVVEPSRIRKNMQTLAHEINGNLDRENLPEKCIDSEVIPFNTFNKVKTSFATSTFSMQNKPIQFVELMTITLDVPVDCVIIAHFGCSFAWFSSDDTLLHAASSGADLLWNSFQFDYIDYAEVFEHFADFRLTINGEDVCKTLRYPFLRQKQSAYLTGVLQVVAGQVVVSVEAKLSKDKKGKISSSEIFHYEVNNRNLVVQAKKR